MATIDLGVIKPVFKGAYNNSTAYILDNIVTSGGSSYICILASTGNAVSNGTYWAQLAAGGTDVGTTLTTQGDVLYRDGSGLQRLAKGTAGQAILMNSGATAPEWGSAGKAVEMHVMADALVGSIANGASYFNWSFTPTISGKVFLSHVGTHRAAVTTHFYMEYGFNNGSGWLDQQTHGVAYAGSGHDHNQGWSWASIPTTTNESDSTTAVTVTANTACTFRCILRSGGTSNQADDVGKDHIVSAIVFET